MLNDFSRHLSAELVIHEIPLSIHDDLLIKIRVKSHLFSLLPFSGMYSRLGVQLTRCGFIITASISADFCARNPFVVYLNYPDAVKYVRGIDGSGR